MEKAILELDQEQGFAKLILKSNERTVSLKCQTTGMILFLKRMAANLFFGLCVEDEEATKQKASEIMDSTFRVENSIG